MNSNPGQPKSLCATKAKFEVNANLSFSKPSFSAGMVKATIPCDVPDCPKKIKAANNKEQTTGQSKKP